MGDKRGDSRKEKIEWLKNIITGFYSDEKNKSQVMVKNKLVSKFCLEFNSTRKTCLEILRVLEDSGFIRFEDDYLILI